MGKDVYLYQLLNVLLMCSTAAWSADCSRCRSTYFGSYKSNATCVGSLQQYTISSNTRLFVETDSKVLCSGSLSSMQLRIYHRLVDDGGDDDDKDGERSSRSDDEGCEWGVQFGLLRRNLADEFLPVNGSNSTWINGFTSSTSCEILSINFTYPNPRPRAVTGDHFAVLVQIHYDNDDGRCVVQPFPLSLRTDNTKQLPPEFDTLSDVKLNSSTVERSPGWNSCFDARIQLTGSGTLLDCTRCDCCTPTQPSPHPASILTPSPTASVSPSLVSDPNAAGPTVPVPIAAIPFITLGPVIIISVLLLLMYIVCKRKSQRPVKRSRGNTRASNSSASAQNLSSLIATNVESYRDPVDAVVMMETSNHTDTSFTTTIRNNYVEDYSLEVEEDPYKDPDSLLGFAEGCSGGRDSHSYAVLEQSPRYPGHRYVPPFHKSGSAGGSSCVLCEPDTELGGWQYTSPASSEDELLLQLKELSVRDISLDHLQILDEKLGIGEFGVVRRGVWSVGEEEREVAVKSLADGSTEEKRIQFLQEAAIMGQFKHPSIISIHGIVNTTTQMPLIILEILVKGDLKRHLMSLKPKRRWQTVPVHCPGLLLSYCRQVAAGMAYLQSRDFVHRDLAARNILISCDDVCKIADFGLARHLCSTGSQSMLWTGRIPVRWTAPEAIHWRQYTSACDVWSFGVLVWEIWSLGSKPYPSLTDIEQVLCRLREGYRMAPPPGCPSSLYKLMVECWHPDPEQRPNFAVVLQSLQHPDFKLLTWTAEDVAAYTEEARTLGAPLEAGEELFQNFQQFYIQ